MNVTFAIVLQILAVSALIGLLVSSYAQCRRAESEATWLAAHLASVDDAARELSNLLTVAARRRAMVATLSEERSGRTLVVASSLQGGIEFLMKCDSRSHFMSLEAVAKRVLSPDVAEKREGWRIRSNDIVLITEEYRALPSDSRREIDQAIDRAVAKAPDPERAGERVFRAGGSR